MRGLQSGQLDPKWFPLAAGPTNYLTAAATPANIAAAQSATGLTLPSYPWYQAAAGSATSSAGAGTKATIQHMLTWMPQYAGTTDTWPDVANANYNAFQLSLTKRTSHGLSFTVNYTFSKNIDDAGTQRSGYAIPASAILTGQAYSANRIDRSLSANSQPESLTVYSVYALPFGKGKIGGDHFAVRAIAGGWKLSGISQYSSGLPLAVTASCTGVQGGALGQGTCMPDLNPAFSGSARINGGWGQGVTAATLGTMKYINSAAFSDSKALMIGDAPRIAPYGLRGQSNFRLNLALRRDFFITERAKLVFGVDCANATNHVTFGNNAQNNQIPLNSDTASSFGTLVGASADPRAFQFSGRLEF
jgi:hypothetical protein